MLLAACFLLPVLAISNQSLWIDEAWTAVRAQPRTLHDWWRVMVEGAGADLQMPGYMFLMWVFARIGGSAEWALRAANLIWFLPGMVAVVTTTPALNERRLFAGAFLATSPFVWRYLDEARPYAMQLGASLLIFAALCRLREVAGEGRKPERRWAWALGIGLVLLSGSSLTGMVWAGAAVLGTGLALPGSRLVELARRHWSAWLATGAALAGLATYYLWTLTVGARASGVAGTDWKNVLFIAYELLGFSGLGPGRLDMRGTGLAAFKGHLGWLAAHAAVVGVVLIASLRGIGAKVQGRVALGMAVGLTAAAGFLLLTGAVAHFRVLGRHFTPAFVLIVPLCGLGLSRLWSSRHWAARLAVLAFLGLSLFSALNLRFAQRHERDDYRDVAVLAKRALAARQIVWWSADRCGADYYGVPNTTDPRDTSKALHLMNASASLLTDAPVPAVIIASKPDAYDGPGALAQYIRDRGFEKAGAYPAFTIWRRKGD